MEKEDQRLYCTVKTDTTYGKNVLYCVEQLKERLGLSVNRILQDAILFYEASTRDRERLHAKLEKTEEMELHIDEVCEPEDVEPEKKADIYSLLSGGSSDYQM